MNNDINYKRRRLSVDLPEWMHIEIKNNAASIGENITSWIYKVLYQEIVHNKIRPRKRRYD